MIELNITVNRALNIIRVVEQNFAKDSSITYIQDFTNWRELMDFLSRYFPVYTLITIKGE